MHTNVLSIVVRPMLITIMSIMMLFTNTSNGVDVNTTTEDAVYIQSFQLLLPAEQDTPMESMDMIEEPVYEITEDLQESIVVEEVIMAAIASYESTSAEVIDSIYDFSEVPLDAKYINALIDACEEFDIDIPIALGMIDTESDFNPTVVSSAGCIGLMQLHPRYFDVDENTDPALNIYYGLEYLDRNIEKYKDINVALNVYNKGHVTGDTIYCTSVMKDAAKWAEITGAPLS